MPDLHSGRSDGPHPLNPCGIACEESPREALSSAKSMRIATPCIRCNTCSPTVIQSEAKNLPAKPMREAQHLADTNGEHMKQGYVYILANANRTLYTGVTSDLEQRVWQHKSHTQDGFTKRYNVTNLVWFAEFARIEDAIAFEKSLKGKSRAKKIALVEESNPRWNDLAWAWFAPKEILGNAEDCASRGDSSLHSE